MNLKTKIDAPERIMKEKVLKMKNVVAEMFLEKKPNISNGIKKDLPKLEDLLGG